MTIYYLAVEGTSGVEHVLEAWSGIAELAELVDCAMDAGDRVMWLRASGGRTLSRDEFTQLIAELAAM